MRFRNAGPFRFLVFGLLGGCMSAPQLPDESRIGLADVIDRARCELKIAIQTNPRYQPDPHLDKHLAQYEARARAAVKISPDLPSYDRAVAQKEREFYDKEPAYAKYLEGNFIDNLAAALVLTLQVKDFAGVANNVGSATWSAIPIPAGLFSFKLFGGVNGTARRTATYKVSLYMSEVRTWDDQRRCVDLEPARDASIRLDGVFGIAAWLERTVDAAFRTSSEKHFTSTGVTLEFTLTPTLGVAPTWAIVNTDKTKFDGTFTVGGQRDYDNTLDFVVAAVATPPGPSIVYVANFPPTGPRSKFAPFALHPRAQTPLKTFKGSVDPATQQRLDNAILELQQRGAVRLQQ